MYQNGRVDEQNNELNSQVVRNIFRLHAIGMHTCKLTQPSILEMEKRDISTSYRKHEQDALKCQKRYLQKPFMVAQFQRVINTLTIQNLLSPY